MQGVSCTDWQGEHLVAMFFSAEMSNRDSLQTTNFHGFFIRIKSPFRPCHSQLHFWCRTKLLLLRRKRMHFVLQEGHLNCISCSCLVQGGDVQEVGVAEVHLLPHFGCMSSMRDGHSTLWAPSRAFWPSACLVNNRLAWLTLSACRRWILNSIHPNLPSHPRARQRLQSCFHKSVWLTRCFWWADPRLGIGQFCCHNPLSPPILVQMTMSGQAKHFLWSFFGDWHFSSAISSEYPQTLCHLYWWNRK